MKNFRDLKVWEKAHSSTLDSYRFTNAFPRQELFGLTSQTRRANVSIAANIAEGCGKRGNGEFQRCLNIAAGSASELEYHVLLTGDLRDGVSCRRLDEAVGEVKLVLSALVRQVEAERLAG
jgi:four helix bundle protein